MRSENTYSLLFGFSLISISCFLQVPENTAFAAQNSSKPPYIVVVDPGHGGNDTGTLAESGKTQVYEKNIALAISQRLVKELQNPTYSRTLGRKIRVVLTRNTDKEVSLEARAELAKSSKADLFVSIHCNSDTTHTAHGVETYFLNNTDNESSSKLEEIENRTTKKYANAKPASLLLRSIAADAVVDSSREAAKTIHESLVDHLRHEDVKLQNRGVKQAMLYVLLDSQVPAVLIEAFYLSNKKDLAFVTVPENRQKIAEGIARGILRFLALR